MWRPTDESQACSFNTAIVEYLRATRGWQELTPEALLQWQAAEPAAYAAILAEISGNQPKSGSSAETKTPGTSAAGDGLPNR